MMGLKKIPRIENYWSASPTFCCELLLLKRFMTSHRFWKIWSNLHVVDNSILRPSICPESSGTVLNFYLYICPVTDTPKSLDCPGNSPNEVAREK